MNDILIGFILGAGSTYVVGSIYCALVKKRLKEVLSETLDQKNKDALKAKALKMKEKR